MALVTGQKIPLVFQEDNEACQAIIRNGYSEKLRHVTRTHKLGMSFLHELIMGTESDGLGVISQVRVESALQKADAFTKLFDRFGFERMRKLLGISNMQDGKYKANAALTMAMPSVDGAAPLPPPPCPPDQDDP
eukprot:5168161-Amphidinium_carterae.1